MLPRMHTRLPGLLGVCLTSEARYLILEYYKILRQTKEHIYNAYVTTAS